jgi:hypothetical protein
MLKLNTSPKTVEVPLAKRGVQTLAKRDTYQVTPVYEITSDQFSSPTFALQLMGDQLADFSQASGTASTFTFTAKAGRAYQIGKYNITIKNVKVGAAEKIPGTDYFIDDPNVPQPPGGSLGTGFIAQNGVIILPVIPAGIADGATVVVTYDSPALTREQYVAFTKLNRKGTLTVYAEDETGADAREIWTMIVQLSGKNTGDIDPTKFREAVLEASIFGNPNVTVKKT